MKRIKTLKGYTIYQCTELDEKRGDGMTGEFKIYFSSDIRDFGRQYSYPEYDDLWTLEDAIDMINDDNFYSLARTLCENESTCVSYEDIENKRQQLIAEMNADKLQAMQEDINADGELSDADEINETLYNKETETTETYYAIKTTYTPTEKNDNKNACKHCSYSGKAGKSLNTNFRCVNNANNELDDCQYNLENHFYKRLCDAKRGLKSHIELNKCEQKYGFWIAESEIIAITKSNDEPANVEPMQAQEEPADVHEPVKNIIDLNACSDIILALINEFYYGTGARSLGSLGDAEMLRIKSKLEMQDYCIKHNIQYDALTADDYENKALEDTERREREFDFEY